MLSPSAAPAYTADAVWVQGRPVPLLTPQMPWGPRGAQCAPASELQLTAAQQAASHLLAWLSQALGTARALEVGTFHPPILASTRSVSLSLSPPPPPCRYLKPQLAEREFGTGDFASPLALVLLASGLVMSPLQTTVSSPKRRNRLCGIVNDLQTPRPSKC